jgi:hypothetical protein
MSPQQQPKVPIKIDEEYSHYQCMLVGCGELGESAAQQIHALDDIGILRKTTKEKRPATFVASR